MFGFFRRKSQSGKIDNTRLSSATPLDQALQTGDYEEAVKLLEGDPSTQSDPGKLFMVVELKTLLEDFDGATTDLEKLSQLEQGDVIKAEFEHIIVNARLWCQRQAVPELGDKRLGFDDTPKHAFVYTMAMHFHADGQKDMTKNILEQAQTEIPKTAGKLYYTNGRSMAFSDARDADDLTGPFLTCSLPEGLFDVPFTHLAEIEFLPRKGFVDSLWNPAHITTRTGSKAFVRVFAYYVGTGQHESAPVRKLGMTTWDNSNGYAVAYGQRDLKFFTGNGGGMALVGINQVARIMFSR